MSVYVSAPVVAVQELYGDHAGVPDGMARRLADGHRTHHPGAAVVLSNWHPDGGGATSLSDNDFRLAVAREHGCPDWAALRAAVPSPTFEAAVTAVLAGDIATLTALLTTTPDLATQRSHWGHHATLLCYLTANGVETYRQVVPANAAEVAALLLAHGADPDATAHAYGRELSVVGLLVSSAHPRAAGVIDGLLSTLGRTA